MALCIARSKKTLMHYFFRTLDGDSVDRMEDKDLPLLVNKLTGAKTHKQLAAAVDGACLLFDARGTERQPSRIMTAGECANVICSDFGPVDARTLAQEMFMASPRRLRADSSKSSPAADFDAFSCGFVEYLDGPGRDELIAVEPVQDWMTFRNYLTIGAALLANIENPPQDGRVLDAAGFSKPRESAYDFSVYVIPFKFHASAFGGQSGKHPIASLSTTDHDVDYLYMLCRDGAAVDVHKNGVIPVNISSIGGDSDVFVSTHYHAAKKGFTPADLVKLPFESDTNLYLCVAFEEDENQIDLAKKVVRALWTENQHLTDGGRPLGMEWNPDSLFSDSHDIVTFRSLISQAWHALCYHKGRRLAVCKYCGSGMLASNKGPVKEFCGDSCRVQYLERMGG